MKPEELREIVLNTTKPLVLRKFKTNWSCFDGTLSEWCAHYDKSLAESEQQLLLFERISKKDTATPQWERKRERLQLTAKDFLKTHANSQNFWTGLNYKRAHELPDSCTAGIDFSCFGFEEHNRDFTFWLSSEGANTPCHYDTYGANIVVQVYGKKSWLLFPNAAPLTSTRIPFEESSVYCLENLYAPAPTQLKTLEKLQPYAYHCVLEPQDVLIVPPHWWHFVETLETSLSVNYWVPLRCDLDHCLDEIIVKFLIESFVRNESQEIKDFVLNPNQIAELDEPLDLFELYSSAMQLNSCVGDGKQLQMDDRIYWPNAYKTVEELEPLLKRFKSAEVVQTMSASGFEKLLLANSVRFDENASENSPVNPVLALLLNSICTPHIIAATKKEFNSRKCANTI